ncbi:hypothetical protein DPMN_000617 [Dreissena polymorpha]|uniref:Uncharacterized protein n=1 Tax=Dreissena polymorpha TaxID=45954 RepID=A0A9D4RS99_DREPO|nr:hypothetical protein DPMN_000617 [Dreissena polymorpha]
MWTDGRRTKTNPKTSPEQSVINKTNVLTERDDKAKMKTAPPPCGHPIFSPNVNHWANNVTSRKTAPPPGSHVIQLTGTIFELNSRIKETNVLTKFHEILAKNVTSRVFTCFHYIHIEKNAPRTGGHVFSPIWTIFELVRDINKTNVLTNFHDDWAKIVTSRVFTIWRKQTNRPTDQRTNRPTDRQGKNNMSPTTIVGDIKRKTAPPTGGHVFQRTGTTFKLIQHIIKANILTNFELDRNFIGTKLLTKFHEDRTRTMASRVLTNKC